MHQAVHSLGCGHLGVGGEVAAEELGQVWVPVDPVVDSLEQLGAVPARRVQGGRELPCLIEGEVGKVEAGADVEGGDLGVAHELARCGDSHEAEGQPLEPDGFGAPIVAIADRAEELVGGKGKGAHEVDLVDEHDEWLF